MAKFPYTRSIRESRESFKTNVVLHKVHRIFYADCNILEIEAITLQIRTLHSSKAI